MFWNISKLKQFWSSFPLKSLCHHHCHGCHLLTLCDPLQSLPRLWARGWSGLVAWQDAGRAALVRKRAPSGKLNTPKNFTLPSRTQSGQKGIHKQSTHWAPRTSLQTVTRVELKGSLKGWEVGDFFDFRYLKPLLSTSVHSFIQFSSFPSALFSVGKKRYSLFYSSRSSDDELSRKSLQVDCFSFHTFVSVSVCVCVCVSVCLCVCINWVKRDKALQSETSREIADVHSKTTISIQFCVWLKSHFFCKYFHLFQMHSWYSKVKRKLCKCVNLDRPQLSYDEEYPRP